jgi:pSer/pThr/pTyr-binding forkhead associated (FHA) protein
MADPRLDSGHFLLSPRRQQYRDSRDAVLEARGWLTLAGECARGVVGQADDWPSLLPLRPDQIVPGTRYLLFEPQRNQVYPLETGLNTVGRFANNDVVLAEPTISRRHCVLLVHAWGGCDLHDTASRNGTLVNGQRIVTPHRLNAGDRIQVCNRLLLFVREKDYQAFPASDPGSDTHWA